MENQNEETSQTSDNDNSGAPFVTYAMPPGELAELISVAVGQTVAAMLSQTRTSGHVIDDGIAASGLNTSMQLPTFDPDKSAYSVDEWLSEITRLKGTLNIDPNRLILHCGHSLRGRAATFYNNWRPIERNWENFVADFSQFFPDGETHGSRMYKAATLNATGYRHLTEYAADKIRALKAHWKEMPWDVLLSCVEYGLQDESLKNLLRFQPPKDQRDLLNRISQHEVHNQNTSATSYVAKPPADDRRRRHYETQHPHAS